MDCIKLFESYIKEKFAIKKRKYKYFPKTKEELKDDWDKYNFYRKHNYSYIVVWEHELNNKENIENIKKRILLEVKNAEHNERIIYK